MTPTASSLPQTPSSSSSSRARGAIAAIVLGVLLGFSLSNIGFTDYGQLFSMLTFADLRLIFVFGGAVLVSAVAYRALSSAPTAPAPITVAVVGGGLLFGVGWALCGACPGVAFAQLGEGKLSALPVLAGVFFGTWLVRRRSSSSPTPTEDGSCCGAGI